MIPLTVQKMMVKIMINQTEAVIKKQITFEMRGLERSCPAKVSGIDKLKEGFINVKPIVNKVNTFDGNNYPYPEIKNVRVIFPSTKNSTFCFPIDIDDEVLLVFQSCNIQKFVSGNKSQHAPIADTYNNLADVVAYVGFQTTQDSCFNPINYTNDFSIDDLNIVHNKRTDREITLTLRSDGSVGVIAPKGVDYTTNKFKVNCEEFEVNASKSSRIFSPLISQNGI